MSNSDSVFVNITGNIGAGTTTLCKNLCSYLDWNYSKSGGHKSPFLHTFYNTGKFAFQNQVYIITESFKNLLNLDLTKSVCQDYSFYEHQGVYSKSMLNEGFLTKKEFLTLKKLSDTYSKTIPKPDLLVYLQSDVSEAKKRIKKRNRSTEKKIDLYYLEKLQRQLDLFTKRFKICPVIKVDTNEFDVRKKESVKKIVNQIFENI